MRIAEHRKGAGFNDPVIVQQDASNAQVCVPMNWDTNHVAEWMNRREGLIWHRHKWRLKEYPSDLGDALRRIQCPEYRDCDHVALECTLPNISIP